MLEPAEPWFLNDAACCVEAEGLSVSFAVHPFHRDVRIVVSRSGHRLFEFNLTGVADVKVIDEPGVDAVEVTITKDSWLRLQLQPVFEVTQSFSRYET